MTNEEVQQFRETKTEDEWNDLCDTIKHRYGGYPADWFQKIVISGVMAEAKLNWSKNKNPE